jgi:hypothetical protein
VKFLNFYFNCSLLAIVACLKLLENQNLTIYVKVLDVNIIYRIACNSIEISENIHILEKQYKPSSKNVWENGLVVVFLYVNVLRSFISLQTTDVKRHLFSEQAIL